MVRGHQPIKREMEVANWTKTIRLNSFGKLITDYVLFQVGCLYVSLQPLTRVSEFVCPGYTLAYSSHLSWLELSSTLTYRIR
ncbi:hypothetical protein VNO80_15019 [Phaseolus coccineus]|uniref:Uncharacterized protein n=1 Tax=Phaseolus coccineus TaxID=3886 RepID=A0AAN9R1F5_PHACN